MSRRPRKKFPIGLVIIKLVPMIREIIEQLRAAKQDDGKAPLIDYFVVQANVKRRVMRNV